MSDHDILSDAEREALSAVMLEPDLPPQRVLIVDDEAARQREQLEVVATEQFDVRQAGGGGVRSHRSVLSVA